MQNQTTIYARIKKLRNKGGGRWEGHARAWNLAQSINGIWQWASLIQNCKTTDDASGSSNARFTRETPHSAIIATLFSPRDDALLSEFLVPLVTFQIIMQHIIAELYLLNVSLMDVTIFFSRYVYFLLANVNPLGNFGKKTNFQQQFFHFHVD